MVDMSELVKKAKELQTKMDEAQAKMDMLESEGSSGGGMVKIVINGKGNMKKITFDESIVKDGDKEILEDLTIAAFNDAKEKLDIKLAEEIKEASKGIGLPTGFPPFF